MCYTDRELLKYVCVWLDVVVHSAISVSAQEKELGKLQIGEKTVLHIYIESLFPNMEPKMNQNFKHSLNTATKQRVCSHSLGKKTEHSLFSLQSPVSIAQQVLRMRSMVNLLGNIALKKTDFPLPTAIICQ